MRKRNEERKKVGIKLEQQGVTREIRDKEHKQGWPLADSDCAKYLREKNESISVVY